jgi:hypothetical protein
VIDEFRSQRERVFRLINAEAVARLLQPTDARSAATARACIVEAADIAADRAEHRDRVVLCACGKSLPYAGARPNCKKENGNKPYRLHFRFSLLPWFATMDEGGGVK